MKRLLSTLSVMFSILFLFSCEDNTIDPQTVQISFSVDQLTQSLAKTEVLKSLDDVDKAVITLKVGETITHNQMDVQLINWGQNGVYRTDLVEVEAGVEYSLSQFELRDTSNATIFAAPLEESPLAFLVDDPLPIPVSVTLNEQKAINVEVLSTDGYTPADFGYPYFVVVDKTMLPFSVAVKTNGNLTTADLTVLYDDSTYTQSLIAGINNIWVNKNAESYTVKIEKDGYVPFEDSFTREEMWGRHFYIELSQINLDLYTELLLHGEGVHGQSLFFDSSIHQRTVTPYGDVFTDSNSYKYGSASAYFDGDNDYLSVPYSADFNFDTNDFTIEFWISFSSLMERQEIISSRNDTNNISTFWDISLTNGAFTVVFRVSDEYVGWYQTENLNLLPNTWYHFAFERNNQNVFFFLNGNLIELNEGTPLANNQIITAHPITIGCGGNINWPLHGHIDELRICNGVARWTKNFTPCE